LQCGIDALRRGEVGIASDVEVAMDFGAAAVLTGLARHSPVSSARGHPSNADNFGSIDPSVRVYDDEFGSKKRLYRSN